MRPCKLAHILRKELADYYELREDGKLAHLLPALRINTCYMISGFPLGAGSGRRLVAHISIWRLCVCTHYKRWTTLRWLIINQVSLNAAGVSFKLSDCSHFPQTRLLFSWQVCLGSVFALWVTVCVRTCTFKCVSQLSIQRWQVTVQSGVKSLWQEWFYSGEK